MFQRLFPSRSIKERNVGNILCCHNGISLLPRRKSMYWKLLVVNPPGIQTTIFPILLSTERSKLSFLSSWHDNSFIHLIFSFFSLNLIFIRILSKAIKVEAESFLFSYIVDIRKNISSFFFLCCLLNVDGSICKKKKKKRSGLIGVQSSSFSLLFN